MIGITDDEGATRGSVFFNDMAGVREFEEKFDRIGPMIFGFHDGQSEAPKIMAKKVNTKIISQKKKYSIKFKLKKNYRI